MDDTNVVPFTVADEGETTGTLWHGKFKAKKRLSLRDQLQRDKIRRELLGGSSEGTDDRALSIAYVFSELAVRLTETPDWWKEQGGGLDMEDANIVTKVYDAAMKVEADAIAERKGKTKVAEIEIKAHQDKVAAPDTK
jgi:hypothetical protein